MLKKLPQFPTLNPDELEFLHRQEKIRVLLAGGTSYGDETASLRVVSWLRSNGYQNWIEIVYSDARKFKLETLLGLPHDLPAEFKLKKHKISVRPDSSFLNTESRSKIEYTNLGIAGARTMIDCELFKTKVCIGMSPYRSYDCSRPGYNCSGKEFRTNVGRFGSDQISIQENSETLVVRQAIPTLNEALLFLNKHHNNQLPPWLPGMVKSVQNGNFLVMPVYGILEYEHNALLTILMGMKHAKKISSQFNRRSKLIWVFHKLPQNSGLEELQSKIVLNHESLPTDVRMIPVNSSSSYVEKTLANTTADTIIIAETGPLPTPIFNALYTSYDLLAVQEGANSANLLLNAQKAFLRCRRTLEDKYWDAIDMTNASPRLRNALIQTPQFLCPTTPNEFATAINQGFPQVLGELMSDALNTTSELNTFFAEFSRQTLSPYDRATLGVREAIALVRQFNLEKTVLYPYYETAIAENPKFVLDGACNHLIPSKIFSHSISMNRTASMRSPHDNFIPPALHHLLNGNFHFAEALAKNSVMSISTGKIPDRLLFVLVADKRYYPPQVPFEVFIKKCLDAVRILKDCKNGSDIAKLKHGNQDLSLLLKFAIAFDFQDQVELILDSNPDLHAEHNGWSSMRVAIAQKNSSLTKRFIEKGVTILAEDLHYAAAQIDDIPTFALLERNVVQAVDPKILLRNVIQNNNYKILKFLANDSFTHETFCYELSNFLQQTDHSISYEFGFPYPSLSPEVALEMVGLIARSEDFPLLLQKCLMNHTPLQLQTLLEAIKESANQFDQVISELSRTDSLPAKHLWMLTKKIPSYFPWEKFLPSIIQGITESKVLAEDLPALGKIVGNTIYTLGNKSLDEFELPGLPVLPDSVSDGIENQNQALALFTPVCHTNKQAVAFANFYQLLHHEQCQATNIGILCTNEVAGQKFLLEIEAIGDVKSLVAKNQHPLEIVRSDFLTCNISSSSQQIDCRGEYSEAKIFIGTTTPTLNSCCNFFFIGFKQNSINIVAMLGLRCVASGALAKITRRQSIIEIGSDLACLTAASILQPTQTLTNAFFTGFSWILKRGQTRVGNSIIYLMSFMMASSYNILLRHRAGEDWRESLSENLGALAAIPVVFCSIHISVKISSRLLPKVSQFFKTSWNAISNRTTSFLGKLSTKPESIFSSVVSFFGNKQKLCNSAVFNEVVVTEPSRKNV